MLAEKQEYAAVTLHTVLLVLKKKEKFFLNLALSYELPGGMEINGQFMPPCVMKFSNIDENNYEHMDVHIDVGDKQGFLVNTCTMGKRMVQGVSLNLFCWKLITFVD